MREMYRLVPWVMICVASFPGAAQQRWFGGGGIGVSTLSADGRSEITQQSTAVSQYKPENGPLVHLFAGRHLRDWLAVQGVYSWNRNEVALVSTRISGGTESTFEQARSSRQHNAATDMLIYFRGRSSSVRPFLSVGLGVMSFESRATALRISKGQPVIPPATVSATKPGLRAAAGIDLMIRGGWGIRYAFLETIQGNPVSPMLSPPAKRGLANFQNLFGVVRYFD